MPAKKHSYCQAARDIKLFSLIEGMKVISSNQLPALKLPFTSHWSPNSHQHSGLRRAPS